MINYDKIYPTLDLHGEIREFATLRINEFIKDNYDAGYNKICIIHGISGGVMRQCTYETLKKNKMVKGYHSDYINSGMTIVDLKEKK